MCVYLVQEWIQQGGLHRKIIEGTNIFFLMEEKAMIIVGAPHLLLAKPGRNGLKV